MADNTATKPTRNKLRLMYDGDPSGLSDALGQAGYEPIKPDEPDPDPDDQVEVEEEAEDRPRGLEQWFLYLNETDPEAKLRVTAVYPDVFGGKRLRMGKLFERHPIPETLDEALALVQERYGGGEFKLELFGVPSEGSYKICVGRHHFTIDGDPGPGRFAPPAPGEDDPNEPPAWLQQILKPMTESVTKLSDQVLALQAAPKTNPEDDAMGKLVKHITDSQAATAKAAIEQAQAQVETAKEESKAMRESSETRAAADLKAAEERATAQLAASEKHQEQILQLMKETRPDELAQLDRLLSIQEKMNSAQKGNEDDEPTSGIGQATQLVSEINKAFTNVLGAPKSQPPAPGQPALPAPKKPTRIAPAGQRTAPGPKRAPAQPQQPVPTEDEPVFEEEVKAEKDRRVLAVMDGIIKESQVRSLEIQWPSIAIKYLPEEVLDALVELEGLDGLGEILKHYNVPLRNKMELRKIGSDEATAEWLLAGFAQLGELYTEPEEEEEGGEGDGDIPNDGGTAATTDGAAPGQGEGGAAVTDFPDQGHPAKPSGKGVDFPDEEGTKATPAPEPMVPPEKGTGDEVPFPEDERGGSKKISADALAMHEEAAAAQPQKPRPRPPSPQGRPRPARQPG